MASNEKVRVKGLVWTESVLMRLIPALRRRLHGARAARWVNRHKWPFSVAAVVGKVANGDWAHCQDDLVTFPPRPIPFLIVLHELAHARLARSRATHHGPRFLAAYRDLILRELDLAPLDRAIVKRCFAACAARKLRKRR